MVLNETAASPQAISQILEQDNNTAKVKETQASKFSTRLSPKRLAQ
jgi:hypothetical protein